MTDPIANGYTAPLHGRGAAGFILCGVFSIVVVIAGASGPNFPLIVFGFGGLVASGVGMYLYFSFMRRKPAIRVYDDRLEFLRGHRRGVLPFADVTNVRAMQWGGSIYPYTRASRFIILETNDGEWQFGPEVANCNELQETVVRLLNRAKEGGATPPAPEE